MPEMVKLGDEHYFDTAGNIWCKLDLWEGYDFCENRWVPVLKAGFYIVVQWPYPVSFMHSMQEIVKHLPDDATVYYYPGNETFAALRRKP